MPPKIHWEKPIELLLHFQINQQCFMPKGGAASYWIDIYKHQVSQLRSRDTTVSNQPSTRTESEQTPTPANTEPSSVHTTTHQSRKRKRTCTSIFDIKLTQLKLVWTQM